MEQADQEQTPLADMRCSYCGATPAYEEIGEGETLSIVLYRCSSCLLKEMSDLEETPVIP